MVMKVQSVVEYFDDTAEQVRVNERENHDWKHRKHAQIVNLCCS